MYIQKGTKEFTKTNLALFAAGLSTFANLYITQPLLPAFSESFAITPATASLSLSIATATLAISLLVFGSLSESLGRKNMMIASIIISSILTIILAFAPTFESLLVLRALQGVALAGVPAIAMAYLGEEMDPASLGVAMGLYISGNSIGGMLGRIVMGMMTDLFSWRIGILVLGGLSIFICCYFVWALPPSKHFVARKLQFKGLLASLGYHLKDPALLSLFGVSFLLMGSFVTLFNYISYKLLDAPYFLSTTAVSWIFIIYLVGTFSSTWFGSLSDRFGRQKVLFAGIFIMFSGALITLPTPLWLKIFGVMVFTFGFFGAHSIASGAVSTRAKKDKAQASSLYLFGYYFGSSVGGTTGGLFWYYFGWNGVIGFITVLLIVAIVLATTYTINVKMERLV